MSKGFDRWMRETNRALARRLYGMVSDDMPDLDWYGLYESGESPTTAVATAIQEWVYWGDLDAEIVGLPS